MQEEAAECEERAAGALRTAKEIAQAWKHKHQAEELAQGALSQCDVEAMREAVRLLEVAIPLFSKVQVHEEADICGALLQTFRRRLATMEEARSKASEGEDLAANSLFESAAELFDAARVDFEAAGCLEYARIRTDSHLTPI